MGETGGGGRVEIRPPHLCHSCRASVERGLRVGVSTALADAPWFTVTVTLCARCAHQTLGDLLERAPAPGDGLGSIEAVVDILRMRRAERER